MKTYAVIFSSQLRAGIRAEYEVHAAQMMELAQKQDGFISVDSVRDSAGHGITVSYWSSIEAIKSWKAHTKHREIQKRGREEWYEHFDIKICEEKAPGTFLTPTRYLSDMIVKKVCSVCKKGPWRLSFPDLCSRNKFKT